MRTVKRLIPKNPKTKIWYLIDANFLANRYISQNDFLDEKEKKLVQDAQNYWSIIDRQLDDKKAIIFILDVCIAETFKTLAKKYFKKPQVFKNVNTYNKAKRKLRKDLQLSISEARKVHRDVKFHDIQTNRDIIIGVDRYFEKASKGKYPVGIFDIMILSTAKYLLDFYGFSKNNLFIITQDYYLYKLARGIKDLPGAYNPSIKLDSYKNVFVD